MLFGDIAMPDGLQNADPCTARGCLWPKASDGKVYVPYTISNDYCKQESFHIFLVSLLEGHLKCHILLECFQKVLVMQLSAGESSLHL